MQLEDKYKRLKVRGGFDEFQKNYPFPNVEPPVESNDFGWFHDDVHAEAFKTIIPKDTKLILEVGSWFGKSSRWFLDNYPESKIICVDTWLGALEQHTEKTCKAALPTLYETFIKNMWPYKERVIPIRNTSDIGMHLADIYKLKPDVVYIDGAHDYWSVLQDISTAIQLFPKALILGDDYQYNSVSMAVGSVCIKENLTVKVYGSNQQCWWLVKD